MNRVKEYKHIYISHRGNITGPNPDRENHPVYVFEAMAEGYDVEIDVWVTGDNVWLGHDRPSYSVNKKMLQIPGLWCHAKSEEALHFMIENKVPNYFWHQEDDVTLTSSGYIWTHSNNNIYTNKSIVCHMGRPTPQDMVNYKNTSGICSDYIEVARQGGDYGEMLNE